MEICGGSMETGIIIIIVIAVILVTIFGLLIDFILYKDRIIENYEEEIELLRKMEKRLINDLKEKADASEEGWVARDSTGDLFCYKSKPVRMLKLRQWRANISSPWKGSVLFALPNDLFPELTWRDEPIKISITYKKVKR